MPDSKLVLLTPVGGDRPSNELPPENMWPPTVGHPLPPYPDHGLPDGGDVGTPGHPIVIPPAPPPYPDNGLPPSIWPGVPIHPDNSLPVPPGTVWPPLPPLVEKPFVALVWIPGVGYKWVSLDPKLRPTPKAY